MKSARVIFAVGDRKWGIMDVAGRALGVDLYKLEHVAKADFPLIAGHYEKAIDSCQRVLDGLGQAMQRPAEFGPDPVLPAYLALHDTMIEFLKQTKSNLDATAVALHRTVQIYANADRTAADELDRKVNDDPELRGKR
ncbi:hypothetical protein DFR70_12712 [Nocardia tenerifensis]|uniref:Excreted virulence factor EspC (Type VII ESX diderm) n=2 Tax=Nocardia tenerifensis TaxID=228006 RepID=A0A318JNQ5_9NOCA|nr:hypothetical protein DFR70_12712 [Nocardia tenerifensis]